MSNELKEKGASEFGKDSNRMPEKEEKTKENKCPLTAEGWVMFLCSASHRVIESAFVLLAIFITAYMGISFAKLGQVRHLTYARKQKSAGSCTSSSCSILNLEGNRERKTSFSDEI